MSDKHFYQELGERMDTALIEQDDKALATLATYRARVRDVASKAQRRNTTRAYAAHLKVFADWCETHHLPASHDALIVFITDEAQRVKQSTLTARMAAIKRAYPDLCSQATTETVRGAMREIGEDSGRAARRAGNVTRQDLTTMLRTFGDDAKDVRDRAILAMLWWGAFRRSEVVALDVADLNLTPDKCVIVLRFAKNLQDGETATKTLLATHSDDCPIAALRAWLGVRGETAGALFVKLTNGSVSKARISGDTVRDAVKHAAKRAGVKAHCHAFRAGCITALSEAGVNLEGIAAHSGHQSLESVRGYLRNSGALSERAIAALVIAKPSHGE